MTNSSLEPASQQARSEVLSPFSLLLVLGAILLSVAFLTGCNSGPEAGDAVNPDEVEVAEDFVLTQTVEGKKAWVLKADSATSLRDEDIIKVYNPHLEFYSREGEIHSTLISDSGFYYRQDSDIKALGHVVVVSADSAVLETDSLKWVYDEERIRTEGSVRVTKGTTIITGDGLESDAALNDIIIERNFRAETMEKER